jgi:hypothetical protein
MPFAVFILLILGTATFLAGYHYGRFEKDIFDS